MRMPMRNLAVGIVTALLTAGVVGCEKQPAEDPASTSEAPAAPHNHPTEGPHHGPLVELGNDRYHAEVVHDNEAGTVTIYLLDSAATNAVPIAATTLLVNMTHDGKPEQFELSASPDVDDPEGKSSRFVSSDSHLVEELDHGHAKAQLVVDIDGTQYRGGIHLEAGHGDHDH